MESFIKIIWVTVAAQIILFYGTGRLGANAFCILSSIGLLKNRSVFYLIIIFIYILVQKL